MRWYGKKGMSALIVFCMSALMTFFAVTQPEMTGSEKKGLFGNRYDESLILWYADEALTDYLTSQAVAYQEKNHVKIEPVLVSGLEYLEQMKDASVKEENMPDLCITNNGTLEKAYLSGLASQVTDEEGILNTEHFPAAALNAVKWHDKNVAYPLSYETAFLLFNKTYMKDLAREQIQAEADAAEGEAAQAEADAAEDEGMPEDEMPEDTSESDGSREIAEEEILSRMSDSVPATIDDILTFADEYNAPENVESVFKWDVSDIFYNYFFVGNYLSVGGDAGDQEEEMDIYNEDVLNCLRVYQELNQFFSIDPKEVSYESIVNEFLEGKTVFTIATTDVFEKLAMAQAEGTFPYEYGVAALPDVSTELASRGCSVTNCVAVNGYSQKKQEANEFASYLVTDGALNLYSLSGKMASRYGIDYEEAEIGNAMLEYEKSVPVPKLMSAQNFWVKLEIVFTRVWAGENAGQELKKLAESHKEN